jgi:hypothetical protein
MQDSPPIDTARQTSGLLPVTRTQALPWPPDPESISIIAARSELGAGYHDAEVQFFQGTGWAGASLSWDAGTPGAVSSQK